MQMGQRGATMNIGQLDGQPLALQIFNGMTAESTCVNERWAKDQLFRCVCFAGGRHLTILDETVGPIFQSTSSVWRTTYINSKKLNLCIISIHVLRVEDDLPCTYPGAPCPYFNPRPPCGGRLSVRRPAPRQLIISIHVLRVEDDS